jgi:GNAT superfamily N-acetyltransferase
MVRAAPTYRTQELSQQTWPHFERLFSRGNGWDACWCMALQRAQGLPEREFRTRAERGVRNRSDKKELVDRQRAHGILVYADDEPVGWCQFGPNDELPAIDRGRKQPAATSDVADARLPLWRVTCFVVDKRHRRRGVAGVALHAALEAIRQRGGGVVEAYPVACWTHGRGSSDEAVYVHGVGPVAAAWGSFGNVSYSGTVSMFEREGFQAVAVFGVASARTLARAASGYQVLMRRIV